ncbi:MAG: hypothetical protein HYY17_11940 [Planctomycetes bacterium]|nr:hypothetical protein [Planctomycetota bacterium]
MRRAFFLAILTGCGGGGGTDPDHAGPADVREFFPVFAYVTAGGWEDHLIGARAFGIPGEQYPDFVCADLAAHGFNAVWLNNIDYALLPRWLDAAGRHGLKVIAQGMPISAYWDGSGWPWPAGWETIVDDEVKPFYRREVPRFRGDPRLLAYVIQEENPPQPAIFTKMREVMDLCAAGDPTHPAIAEYNDVDSVRMAVERTRPEALVFGVGPFPSPYPGDDEARYFFPWITEQSHQIGRAGGVPLWMILQGGDFDVYYDGTFVRRAAERPTRAQLRWQVWFSLLYGAKGIGYFLYTWQHPIEAAGWHEDLHGLRTRTGQTTEIYEECASIHRSIAPIRSLLLRLDAETRLDDQDYHWTIRGPGVRSRTFVYRDTRERYLMLVNYDFVLAHPAIAPAGLSSARFEDVRTGRRFSAGDPGSPVLQAGDGTLLRILSP